jgi:DHA1 family tetracycline resistance protein-like MFS transporter
MDESKSKKIIALLYIVFVDSMGSGLAFSVFATLFFDQKSSFFSIFSSESSRHIAYGILLGIYNFCMFFCAPIIGTLSDHYGRRPILILSMAGLTLGFIFSALGCFYVQLILLVLGRVVSGVTAGSLSVAQASVVDSSNANTKSFYLSLIVIANCLGFSLGPFIGQLLLSSNIAPLGTMTFLAGAVLSIFGLLLVVVSFKRTKLSTPLNKKRKIYDDFLDIKYNFVDRVSRYRFLSFSFSMLAYCLFFSNIPIFINHLTLASPSVMGYILSSLVVALSISTSLGGKYAFRKKEGINSLDLAQILQMIIFLILAFCFQSLSLNITLFILASLCFGIIYIGLLTLLSDMTASSEQGRIMGVVASISALVWTIGSWSSGWLNYFGASVPFMVCTLLMFMAIATIRKSRALTINEATK